MKLLFIDETSDAKFKDYLGFSLAFMDSRSYPKLKSTAHRILVDIEWDNTVEFKGSYLFSRSKGCQDVEVERRIEAARELLELNVAESNSRIKFYYGEISSTSHTEDYLAELPGLLAKCLPKPSKGAGKNLIAVCCDERSDISADDLHHALAPSIQKKGWILLERIQPVRSSFDTVGLMFADIVGYLTARIVTISNDSELFEGLTPEQFERNGKIRKLRSSTELISLIKQIQVYKRGMSEHGTT